MRVTFHDHGGKGQRIAEALHAAAHETVGGLGDVALVDHDHYQELCDAHERVIFYPHGAGPVLSWDGVAPHSHVRLALVHAPGVAEVMAAYGFPAPTEAIGWDYCDLAEPRYPASVERILYAPIHPLANGYLNAAEAAANRRVLDLLVASGRDVSVRIFGSPKNWGLDPGAAVRWVPGGALNTADIDATDLVVGYQTVLHLALARGVPVLAMHSDAPPDLGHEEPRYPAHWDDYAHLMRYPYDIEDAPLDDLVAAVTQPDAAVEDYRARFVGGPFEAERAVKLIEGVAALVP